MDWYSSWSVQVLQGTPSQLGQFCIAVPARMSAVSLSRCHFHLSLPVRMQFIDSKGVTLKDDILTFPETPDKWKMVSTTTGTFINAGYYKVLLSAEDMNGLAFDALEIQ